jgi:hypothetical protein
MIVQGGGPPDTSVYYHVAYAWLAVLYIGYSVTLSWRNRRVRARIVGHTRSAHDVRAGGT